MIVAVAVVRVMQAGTDQVVNMVAVRNGFVAASRTMEVLAAPVLGSAGIGI